jgi:putative nucleotidyltransferase with HDIG domain
LDQVKKQLEIDAADTALQSAEAIVELCHGHWFQFQCVSTYAAADRRWICRQAALEQRAVEVPDLVHEQNGRIRAPLVGQESFVYYRATPLVSRGEVRGVLEIFHRSRLFPSIEWQQILQGLSTEAAIAIDNATLFDKLQQSNAELAEAYDSTIEGWARTLDMRDHEVEGHTQRVTELAVQLGQELGLKPDELVNLRRGALLHDIGKMRIPDSILLKSGRYTQAEVAEMRKHPVTAYELLSPIDHLRPAIDIPYCHHEKWDGSGYPRGLKGEEIPLAARIFTVVDVWDVLRSSRRYRNPMSEEKSKEYLREHSGKLFDPAIVNAFLRILET